LRGVKKRKIDYVGFQEVIVQHAPHEHKRLKFKGINLDLKSEKILRTIDIILKNKKPVISHVELNDYEEDSKRVISQLLELSTRHPESNFLLIHMGQVEFSGAKLMLEKTKNIHFMTSHADNETQNKILNKDTNVKSQTGWINLFDKDNNLQKKWINLMNENPLRFVVALDNVWDFQWLEGYAERVLMWRKALASLNKDTAGLIACGNSNEYFKLGIECLSERK
jgi:hypothetical protein